MKISIENANAYFAPGNHIGAQVWLKCSDAEARRVAAEIEARTGEKAVAPTGTVDKALLREDLRRSNARRAGNAVRDMKRGVREGRDAAAGADGRSAAAAARRKATQAAWADTAKSRRSKRFVDSRAASSASPGGGIGATRRWKASCARRASRDRPRRSQQGQT